MHFKFPLPIVLVKFREGGRGREREGRREGGTERERVGESESEKFIQNLRTSFIPSIPIFFLANAFHQYWAPSLFFPFLHSLLKKHFLAAKKSFDDDVFYLFLQKTKIAQRYMSTGNLPLVIKKARVMMLLSCPLWCHKVSFSPSVNMMLHLAPTSPPLSVPFVRMIDTLLRNYVKWILLVHTP